MVSRSRFAAADTTTRACRLRRRDDDSSRHDEQCCRRSVARRAVCGGGATWADVDAATQQHGLATPGGFISHTGIGGLTLGGGIGWLDEDGGLACDNLVGAEVVTADSRVVRASKDEHPDLFWALRGGGGNFGVVTSFEFALHPVGPIVNLGLFFFGLEDGAERFVSRAISSSTLPQEATAFLGIGLSAPPAPFVPAGTPFRPGHALLVVGFGSAEDHRMLIAPIRQALPPLFELVTPMPFVALQQMFNESATWGMLATRRRSIWMTCRTLPSRSSASTCREKLRRCRSARHSLCPARIATPSRERHRVRRKPRCRLCV